MNRLTTAALLALLAFAALARAEHAVCSWLAFGSGSPKSHGFTKFCTAPKSIPPADQVHATYYCEGTLTKVADFSYLRSGILEFSTPCAKHGYGGEHCSQRIWAVCLPSVEQGGEPRCYNLSRGDDCEWPTGFFQNTLPDSVDIYYL